MEIFYLTFVPVMVLTPAIFVQFYRPRPGDQLGMARITILRRRLYAWTGVTLFIFVGAFMLRASDRLDWWSFFPFSLLWLAFFPLWFACAMPLLLACRPEGRSAFANQRGELRAARSASLAPRAGETYLFKGAQRCLAAIWLLGLALTLFLGWPRDSHEGLAGPTAWLPILLVLSALIPVATIPMINRRLMAEPEPMDSGDSPQLAAAYANLRATKAKGLFTFSLIVVIALVAVAVLSVSIELDNNLLAGLLGGGGSLIGIAGATFGVTMSNRRMQINRLLNELSRSSVGDL